MLEDNRRPSYWAVLPAAVRYDPQLKPNAKLIYAEITALQESSGYCWASNKYLGDLFTLKPDTVGKLISELETAGYVEVSIIRDVETKEVLQRRVRTLAAAPLPDKNPVPLPDKNPVPLPDKNPDRIIQDNNDIPPKAPQGGQRRKRRDDWRETAEHMPERFERFWKAYPRGEKRQAAIRAWDKLAPTAEMADQMAAALKRQLQSEDWQRGIGIPHPSTWLNQRRWTDEIRVTAKEPAAEQAYDPRGGLTAW